MPTLSASDLEGVFTNVGVSVITDMYTPDALWFLDTFEVGDIGAISSPEFGDASSNIVFGTGMDEHDLGAPANGTTAKRGYTPQGAVRRFKKDFSIPMELLGTPAQVQRQLDIAAEFTKQQQVWYTGKINRDVANVLNKGSLTAGDSDTFRASYQDHDVTWDGFAYDGLPLFSNSHALRAPNGSTTTYDNYMASLTLDAANFNTALIQQSVTNAINEAGDAIDIQTRKLLVPWALRQAGFGILNTQNVPGSANYNANVNAPNGQGIVDQKVVRHLTDAAAWFLVAAPEAVRVRLSNGGNLQTRFYEDKKTNSMVYEVSAQHLVYPRDGRHLLACNTAQS